MAHIITTTFQFKRGSAARWQELNLILEAGEPGFELDTGLLKVGNGNTPWNELDYINQGGGGSGENILVSKATAAEFPVIGDPDKLYKATEEKLLYQWNDATQTYEALGSIAPGGEVTIEVDTELSVESDNPIANSVVTNKFNEVDNTVKEINEKIENFPTPPTEINVNQLVQTEGEVLIFYGGTSTDVI